MVKKFTHINLVRRPTVHGQGLDLGDMGAQFAMQRSTSHAQEESHLLPNHQYLMFFGVILPGVPDNPIRTFQLAHPVQITH